MKKNEVPIWHPISSLPMISSMITGQLNEAKIQYNTLLEVRHKPHILNDEIVSRIFKLFSEQQEYIPIYSEQLTRWDKEPLSADQQKEIVKLKEQVESWEKTVAEILILNNEISHGTIDRILSMSDEELAIKILSGEIPKPK